MKLKMITILIVGNNIADNEQIAGSIIGGTELTTCIICTHSAPEALKSTRRQTGYDRSVYHQYSYERAERSPTGRKNTQDPGVQGLPDFVRNKFQL